MLAEIVVDASVAAKVFLTEVGSPAAEALFLSGMRTVAPDLVIVELTNVAVKRVQAQGHIPRVVGERMTASARTMYDEFVPAAGLMASQRSQFLPPIADAAFPRLRPRPMSRWQSSRGCNLVTADLRLMARLARSGLSVTVRAP